MSDGSTIVGDVEALLNTNKSPVLVVLEALVGTAIPAVLEALDGETTPVEIAGPYVAELVAFVGKSLTDMIGGKGAAAVLRDLDSMCADMIETIRVGSA